MLNAEKTIGNLIDKQSFLYKLGGQYGISQYEGNACA